MITEKKPLVLITGSSGLIGRRLMNRLSEHYQCVGIDKEGNPHANLNAECICIDITDTSGMETAFLRIKHIYGLEIESVIHLAAYYDFSGEPSDLYYKVAVQGTENLLNALQEFVVKQFIFSSTNLIYKSTHPGKKIKATDPLEPPWDYPKSKVQAEKVILKRRLNIPIVILRLSGVYNEEGNSIPMVNQIQRIYKKDITGHFSPGDLIHGNAFIHLDDLDNAFECVIKKRYDLPEIIFLNISELRTYSYEEIQNEICELIHGKEWRTSEIPGTLAKTGTWVQDRLGDSFVKSWMIDLADDHYEMDISDAGYYLDWEPQHDLKETLPAIISHLKDVHS